MHYYMYLTKIQRPSLLYFPNVIITGHNQIYLNCRTKIVILHVIFTPDNKVTGN